MSEERDLKPELSSLNAWIEGLADGRVDEIEPSMLREFFEAYGANFDGLSPEALQSLGQYSNKAKADGMRAVWEERFEEYKAWAKEWVKKYEQETDILLPALPVIRDEEKVKYSGMLQFLGEVTSFAAECLDFETLKTRLEARIFNGKVFAEGRPEDRIRVAVPTRDGPILLSSIPPGFVVEAWKLIASWGPGTDFLMEKT